MYNLEAAVAYAGGWKLEIVLKIAEACNLACDYCYFYFRGDTSAARHPVLLSEQSAQDFVGFLRRLSEEANFESIQINMHGGEPLLFPKDRFDMLCSDLRAAVEPRADLTFALQTNGTLIDEAWIDLFAKYDVAVGVSLDGPRAINDRHRYDRKQRSSYDDVVSGLGLLKSAFAGGRLRYDPAILCVYDFSVPVEDIVLHFVDDLNIKSFNLLLDDCSYENFIRPDNYDPRIYSKISRILETRTDVVVDTIWRTERMLKRRVHDEELAKFDNLRHVLITVSSSGHIASLDQARMLSDRFQYGDLHVKTAGLVDILSAPAHAEIRRSAEELPVACLECCWRHVCRGGDPIHRFSKSRGFDNASIYCEVLQDLHSSTTAKLIREGASINQIEQALGLSAAEAQQ